MSNQIRGIILEGQSCSGKTSIFNAIKKYHFSQTDAERNVIYLSEHYSQNLNCVNGEFKTLSQEENMKVLSDRVSILEQLNNYADSMGEHSRRSRGLFFVFERFHLNYAFCFNAMATSEYVKLEQKLLNLNAHTLLCTISPENTKQRLTHRAQQTNEPVTHEGINDYINNQQCIINFANKSTIPTTIINTDDLNWAVYSRLICDKVELYTK